MSVAASFLFGMGVADDEEPSHSTGLLMGMYTPLIAWAAFVVASIVHGIRERRRGRAGWAGLLLGGCLYAVGILVELFAAQPASH